MIPSPIKDSHVNEWNKNYEQKDIGIECQLNRMRQGQPKMINKKRDEIKSMHIYLSFLAEFYLGPMISCTINYLFLVSNR